MQGACIPHMQCNFYDRCNVSPKYFRFHLIAECLAIDWIHHFRTFVWFRPAFFAQLIIIMTIIIMILTQSVIKHLQCECHHWEKKNVLYCEIQIERNKNTHKHKNEYCAHFHPGGKRFAHTIRNHLCAPFHHRFFCCCFVVCRFLFHFNWWLCAIKQNYLRI